MEKISGTRVTWYRDTTNKKIGGICSGLSDILDIDVTIVRFVFFMLWFTPVPIITAYLVAWFIVPKKGDVYVGTITNATTTNTPSSKELLTERW